MTWTQKLQRSEATVAAIKLCFKATERLHHHCPLPHRVALSHQYNAVSTTTLQVLSSLHSPGFCSTCCNVGRHSCDLKVCTLVTDITINFTNYVSYKLQIMRLSSVSTVTTTLWTGGPGFDSRLCMFIFATKSTLEPAQTPIQQTPSFCSRRYSGRDVKLTIHRRNVPR